jgi:hypothetical protein
MPCFVADKVLHIYIHSYGEDFVSLLAESGVREIFGFSWEMCFT